MKRCARPREVFQRRSAHTSDGHEPRQGPIASMIARSVRHPAISARFVPEFCTDPAISRANRPGTRSRSSDVCADRPSEPTNARSRRGAAARAREDRQMANKSTRIEEERGYRVAPHPLFDYRNTFMIDDSEL